MPIFYFLPRYTETVVLAINSEVNRMIGYPAVKEFHHTGCFAVLTEYPNVADRRTDGLVYQYRACIHVWMRQRDKKWYDSINSNTVGYTYHTDHVPVLEVTAHTGSICFWIISSYVTIHYVWPILYVWTWKQPPALHAIQRRRAWRY